MKTWRLFIFLSLLGTFLGCELEETSYIKPIPKAAPATDISTTSFMAHWHPMFGVSKYRLDVSEHNDFSTFVAGYSQKELPDTFALIEGLKVNTIYYYRISFENNQSLSQASKMIAVQTAVFESPVALPAVNINEIGLTAVWKPVDGAESYSIDFSDNPAFDKRATTTHTFETKDTAYVFSELEVSRTYYYRVRSRSGKNISDFSKIMSAQTTNLDKPIAKDASEITLTSFRANWAPVDGAKKYLLDVSTDATFASTLKDYTAKEIEALSENIAGLDANREYFFRIRALNNNIKSEFSDVVAAKTAPLDIPETTDATDHTHRSFIANWKPSANAQSYLVSVYTDPELTVPVPNYIDFETVDDSLHVYDLRPDKQYYYTVKAKGLNAISAPSNTISTKTSFIPVPVLKPSDEIGEFGFTCHWEGIEGVSKYLVELSDNATFSNLIREKQVEGLTTTFAKLAPDKTYYIRVSAQNGGTSSAYSNTVATTTEKIAIPTATAPTAKGIFAFTANWEPVDIAEAYEIELATEAEFDNIIRQKTVSVNYIIFEGLQPGLEYFYRVRTKVKQFRSGNSNVVSTSTGKVAVPDALAASNSGLFEFTANWSAVEGADNYILQISKDAGFGQILLQESVDQTYFLVKNLTPGTSYFYRVRAVMNNFPSDYSNTMTATTNGMSTPAAADATNVGLFGLTANWSSIEGAEKYELQLSKTENFSVIEKQEEVTQTYFEFKNLDPSTSYYYRVRTVVNGFPSDFSNVITTTTSSMVTPTTTDATNIGLFNFTANWNPVGGTANYVVELSKSTDFKSIVHKETVSQTYFEFTGLTPGTTYYYRVKVTMNNYSSDFSNAKAVTTNGVTTPMASPASGTGLFNFTANWSAVSDAEKYEIQLSKKSDFSIIEKQEETTQTYFDFTGLEPNTTYYYKVRTVISGFFSNFSNEINVKTGEVLAPTTSAPSNINLFQFTANWSTISGADSYVVQISKDNTFNTFDIQESITQPYFQATGLNPNTTYYYRVKTVKNGFSSSFSNVETVNTLNIQAPVLAAASKISLFGFTASWSTVADADGYDIELATDNGFNSIVSKQTVNQGFVDLQSLRPSTKYFCRVRTIVGNYSSSFSTSIEVTTLELATPVALAATGITNFGFRANWQTVSNAQEYEIEVAEDNAFSSIVTKQTTSEIFFDFSKLEPGKSYYYRVRSLHSGFASTFSSAINVSTVAIPAPVTSTPTKVGNFEFTAEWSTVVGAESYEVELATDASFTKIISVKSVSNNYFDFIDLSPKTNYYFRVKTLKGTHKSAYSNMMSVQTVAIEAPVAQNATAIGIFNFTANWQTVTDANGYVVEIALDAGFTSIQSTISSISTYHTFTDLKPNTDYFYRVKSDVSGFTSSPSNLITCKTLPLPVPTAHEEENKHAFGFTAKWDIVAEATSYEFDLATDAGFTQMVSGYANKNIADNSLIIDKLDYKTTYYYRVRAKRLSDYSDYSSTITVEPAVANCRLEQIHERWSKSLYNIEFTYDADGHISEFFIDRSGTDDDVSFKVYYENNMIKNIDKYEGVAFTKLKERWWPARDVNGRIESWAVRWKSWNLKTLKVITYKTDGKIDRIKSYSDWAKTKLTSDKPYEYYSNGEVNVIYKEAGVKEFRYEYDENTLNPLNLLDPELSIVIKSYRGTSQFQPSTHCPGFEYWANGDPNRLGFYYDVNNLKLPTLKYTTRTIKYIYNSECPIE